MGGKHITTSNIEVSAPSCKANCLLQINFPEHLAHFLSGESNITNSDVQHSSFCSEGPVLEPNFLFSLIIISM